MKPTKNTRTTNGARKDSVRGRRYTDLPSLRTATRAWCAQQFGELARYPWNDVDEAALRDDTAESPAFDTWCALERAVLDARAFLQEHPNVDDGYAARLRRAVSAFPEVYEGTTYRWTRRKAIVEAYDSKGWWWWHDRPPEVRDLAILAILAGEFPEWARNRLKKSISVTVLEVIAAEERAMRQARKAEEHN